MINCRKYTRYLHKSELTTLSWYEKILMQYHYTICKLCRKYTLENQWLNMFLEKEIDKQISISDEEIEAHKQELIQKLQL